jgi:hypothetical protein
MGVISGHSVPWVDWAPIQQKIRAPFMLRCNTKQIIGISQASAGLFAALQQLLCVQALRQ